MTVKQGWYPDPAGGPQRRWWDGERWTERLEEHPGGVAGGAPAGFDEAVRRGFLDWSRGRRASRSEFWWLVLFVWFGQLVAGGVEALFGLPVSSIATLAGTVVLVKVGARRYRDAGRPGWLYLVHFGVGTIALITAFVAMIVGALAAWGNDEEATGVALVVAGVSFLVALVVGVWSLVVLCSKSKPLPPEASASDLLAASTATAIPGVTPPGGLPVINGE